MLNYQSTSFHDALYAARSCSACGRRRSSRPGCERMGIIEPGGGARLADALPAAFGRLIAGTAA